MGGIGFLLARRKLARFEPVDYATTTMLPSRATWTSTGLRQVGRRFHFRGRGVVLRWATAGCRHKSIKGEIVEAQYHKA